MWNNDCDHIVLKKSKGFKIGATQIYDKRIWTFYVFFLFKEQNIIALNKPKEMNPFIRSMWEYRNSIQIIGFVRLF